MSITLRRETTSVTLPDPSPGVRLGARRRQVAVRTQGGETRVFDRGVETWEAALTIESLTAAEKAALEAFVRDAAEGMLRTFTLVTESGAERTARLLSPDLEFHKLARDVYDVTLRLELSASAD